MKKIFIMLILAIAGVAGVQAQSEKEQAFIDGFIEGLDQELAALNEAGMIYDDTNLEGKNIICSIIVDEAQFGGMSMIAAFQMIGVDEETFGEMMRKEMFAQNLGTDERAGLQMLKDYGYKIYFRIIGSPSGEEMNCLVDYEAVRE
jgi:hypothetical protein